MNLFTFFKLVMNRHLILPFGSFLEMKNQGTKYFMREGCVCSTAPTCAYTYKVSRANDNSSIVQETGCPFPNSGSLMLGNSPRLSKSKTRGVAWRDHQLHLLRNRCGTGATWAPVSLGTSTIGGFGHGGAVGTFSTSVLFSLIPKGEVSSVTAEICIEWALSFPQIF